MDKRMLFLLGMVVALSLTATPIFAAPDTAVIRTFVNGNNEDNSTKEVHDLHIEYSTSINGVGILGDASVIEPGELKFSGKTIDVKFKRALRPGESISVVAKTSSNKLGIKVWWWTDGDGKPVVRTIKVGRRTREISKYTGTMRGDEASFRRATDDLYSIVNKGHHWGGVSRQTAPVSITMDIRKFLSDKPDDMSREDLVKNIKAAIKQWSTCSSLSTIGQLPKAGQGNNPSNHGPGLDPAVMAPGPSHDGAKGEKFRSLTDRECAAMFFKYRKGISIEVIESDTDQRVGDITLQWGIPRKYGRALGVGPSQADSRQKDKTVKGWVYMRSPNRRLKWHLAEDKDNDGFITNKDADEVPDDAHDFYSVFKHELGHVLCFNHSGDNFSESNARFSEPRNLGSQPSSTSLDRSPHPTMVGDPEFIEPETVYFASDRPGGLGGLDIWAATWVGTGWEVSNLGSPVNSSADEVDPHLASDGTQLIFASNRFEELGYDLFEAILDLESDEWNPAENMGPEVNSPSDELHPSLRGDMRTLYFASDRPEGAGGFDIWQSEQVAMVGFSEATNVGSPINTPANETGPSISSTAVALYYASDREGGHGAFDLWNSIYGDGWAEPQNLGGGINTPFNEVDPAVRLDNAFLYFSSNRNGGLGGLDLYEVSVVAQPAVGGATSFRDDGSGYPAGNMAILAGGLSAAVVLLIVGGWYARKRILGKRS